MSRSRAPLIAVAVPLVLAGMDAAQSQQAKPALSTHAQARRVFTLADYAKIAQVSGLQLSPSGKEAVLVVARPGYEADTWNSDVVVVDLDTKAVRTVTHTKTASAPRWSPSGDRLAFLARVKAAGGKEKTGEGSGGAVAEKTQLFVIPARGGAAAQVTSAPNGVGGFAWKPDGSGFAYTASPKDSGKSKFDDSFLVTSNDYLARSAPRPSYIYMIAASGGGGIATEVPIGNRVLSGNNLVWSPDGRTLFFGSQAGPGTRLYPKRSVAMVDVRSGAVSDLPGVTERWCGSVTPSPDGKLLLASCFMDAQLQNPSELLIVPAAGGGGGNAPRKLTSLDRDISRGAWSADSRTVVVSAPDSLASGVWEIPVGGAPRRRDIGRMTANEVQLAKDGTIAFVGTEPARPPELYLLRPEAAHPERITDFQANIAALDLGMTETITWTTDGYPVSGVILYPPGFDPSKKYPVLLDIHGGPWGSSFESFAAQTRLFAAQGWIVFEPNYRGSNNVGKAFYVAVYRDHGAGPGRDVMAGLALLKKRPYVDASRIGVSGWSYGGYMTTWLIGHYQGWKAAMAGAAVIDLVDQYNLNDLSLYMRAYGQTLSFPKDLELMKEQSPLTYVDNMTTPLLLLSDAADVRVPVTQSYKLFNALRERGRDVQMRLWPVAGHTPADPWRARDIDEKWMEFFKARFQ